ncbi:MAG: ABC transporter permease [Chlamydiia bacterium]|nr:ABC transporter permease [Chlamydiia bacterium]
MIALFELQVALRYLLPRKRSLSTTLVSWLSILIISLVVWLVLIFLSVTSGMERNWLKKLTSLHAPIRITPTDAYYASYYYRIDSLSAASNFSLKTIGEKSTSPFSDPYDPERDPELPLYWQPADRTADGTLKDPVKELLNTLESLHSAMPDIAYQDYEISGALLRIALHTDTFEGATSYLSQMTYLLSLTDKNPHLQELLLPPTNMQIPHAYFAQGHLHLPQQGNSFPVLLPKNYRESTVKIGDRGTLNFTAPSAAASQEMRIEIYVAGFYDPGILSVGNKCILVPPEVIHSISTGNQTFSPDGTPTNGIFVWTHDLSNTPHVAEQLNLRLAKAGLSSYWKVATYENFEFSKDLMLQFRSDKTLLLLIASIILLVACSNIISLLTLLVNDKKREIASLQSMGASSFSISAIFASCGIAIGVFSCLVGSLTALFTLKHLDTLVSCLSALQGRSAFNPAFFGSSLPNQLSAEALLFICIATPLLSLAAGLIPAWKASRIRPSSSLRSE